MCCDCRCLRLVNLTSSGYLSKSVGDSETRRRVPAQSKGVGLSAYDPSTGAVRVTEPCGRTDPPPGNKEAK